MNRYFELVPCGNPRDLQGRAEYASRTFRGKNISKRTGKPYEFDEFAAYWCMLLRHYGFVPRIKPAELIRTTEEGYLAYFQSISGKRGMLKKKKDLEWYQPFTWASLACLVGGRFESFEQLCSFLRDDLPIEDLAIPKPAYCADFAWLVASHNTNTRLNTDSLLKKMQTSRAPRARQLYACYEHLFVAPDNALFCQSLNKSVELFAKRTDDLVPLVAIANLESLIANCAIRVGFDLSDCTELTLARLLTAESVFGS